LQPVSEEEIDSQQAVSRSAFSRRTLPSHVSAQECTRRNAAQALASPRLLPPAPSTHSSLLRRQIFCYELPPPRPGRIMLVSRTRRRYRASALLIASRTAAPATYASHATHDTESGSRLSLLHQYNTPFQHFF